MPSKVRGYLASDGTFFEREPECKRHEATQHLAVLCDSHGTNFENFLSILNDWHNQIKEYYDADQKCKDKQTGKAEDRGAFDDYDDDGDDFGSGVRQSRDTDDPTLLSPKSDIPNAAVGDKDAPGFLEQQIRRDFRVPDIRDSSHAEAIPPARKGTGSRSRRGDASVLRGDAGVATVDNAKAPRARPDHR